MNIKSLLLGSAAALAAVSGAQAADAIVAAAPEPMEYVKVCDAFGKGYFYIPGTETCLNITGAVRWELDWNKSGALNGNKWSSYNGNTFGRLEINAKNDSEVGTVYSFIRLQGDAGGTGGSNRFSTGYYAGIDAGAVGVEVGNFDTGLTRFLGYGGFTDAGGNYGFMGNSYAAVQGKIGAVSYIAGVDDFTNSAGYTAGLFGGVKGDFDGFGAALTGQYDIAAKSFGLRGYVSGKVDMFSFKVMGIYNQKSTSKYAAGGVKGFTTVIGGKAQLTDKFYAAVDYSYNFDPKTWGVVGDLGWNVASGFDVLVSGKYWSTKNAGGFLRLQRSF